MEWVVETDPTFQDVELDNPPSLPDIDGAALLANDLAGTKRHFMEFHVMKFRSIEAFLNVHQSANE